MRLTITPDGVRKLSTTKRERMTISNAALVLQDLHSLKPDKYDAEKLHAMSSSLVIIAQMMRGDMEDQEGETDEQT